MITGHYDVWRASVESHDSIWWGFDDLELQKRVPDAYEYIWRRSWHDRKSRDITKMFVPDTPEGRAYAAKFKETAGKRRQMRLCPKDYDFVTSMWISGDYVLIFNVRERPFHAFEIFDAQLAGSMRLIFRWLWDCTEPGRVS